jgi:hypothetical protein
MTPGREESRCTEPKKAAAQQSPPAKRKPRKVESAPRKVEARAERRHKRVRSANRAQRRAASPRREIEAPRKLLPLTNADDADVASETAPRASILSRTSCRRTRAAGSCAAARAAPAPGASADCHRQHRP